MNTVLPLPDTLLPFERANVARLRGDLLHETYIKAHPEGDVLHWKTNNAVVPPFVFQDAYVVCPAVQKTVYDRETARFLTEYRRARQEDGGRLDPETAFEMAAAFGSGAEVVDVFSGHRYAAGSTKPLRSKPRR
jgi:hypothetical protein